MPRRIRVLFDEQILLLQEFGGISRYFIELVRVFEAKPELGVDVVFGSKYVRSELAVDSLSKRGLKKVNALPAALFLLAARSIFGRMPQASKVADVIHFTIYAPGYLSRYRGIPRISTIHDMIPERTLGRARLFNPHMRKREYLHSSDALVSVSRNSMNQAASIYGKLPKGFITHLGVSEDFRPRLPKISNLPDKYFLIVGQRSGYKDATTAFRAFDILRRHDESIKLLLVGGGKLTRTELRLLVELGIVNGVVQLSLDSKSLPSAYSNAEALVFPSREEGFGLPILEAMASGTPVLLAETPVSREVALDAALYFTPGDSSGLAQLMASLLENRHAFQNHIDAGLRLSKKYTWLACAQKTAEAYRFAVDQKRKMSL